MLCLCLSKEWKARQGDMKAAFINGDVNRDIFVRYPYNVPAILRSHTADELLKALYGLRQASIQWILKLKQVLTLVLNHKQLQSVNAVFLKRIASSTVIILAYIDYLVFLSSSTLQLDIEIDLFLKCFHGKSEPQHWYYDVQFKVKADHFII